MARKTNTAVNGYNYYKVTRTIGHKADGSPIKKQFYGTGVNEANEKADAFMQDLKLGLKAGKVLTINTLLPEWLFKTKKHELKPNTFEKYESLYRNNIKDNIIANYSLKDITTMNVQKFYNELSKNNSPQKVKNIHKFLHLFFEYCLSEGFLPKNPCTNTTLPKKESSTDEILAEKNSIDFFTEEEIPELLKLFEKSLYKDIIIFALATGMRQGEILGLQWKDLDFKNRIINVRHNLTNVAIFEDQKKIGYKNVLSTPKSKNSIRSIPMNDTVFNMLSNKKRTNDMVFPSGKNKYIESKNLLRQWTDYLKRSNLRYRKFHDLRHTFATLMLSKGCDLITLKELLGHSSIQITEIYLQAIPQTKTEIIKKMDFIQN